MTSERLTIPGQAEVISNRRANARRFEPYLLLLPALSVLFLFFFGPAVYNILLSFQKISLLELAKGGRWVGLENYIELAQDAQIRQILLHTVFWLTAVTVAIRLILGLGLALLLNNKVLERWRLKGLARSLVLIPWLTPPVVAVAVWQWMLHPRYGAINLILFELGLVNQGIPFLVQASTVWWSIVAIIVWRELPFVAISLLAGLQAIPDEIQEAARIDGASESGVFRYVTLPLLRPIIVIVTMLTTIWTFNNFVYVWLTTRGGPGNYTQVLATQMYTEAFTNFRLGLGASIGVLMSVIMMIFAVVYFLTVFRRSLGQT
jgi:multiple sugar transport system permease protein